MDHSLQDDPSRDGKGEGVAQPRADAVADKLLCDSPLALAVIESMRVHGYEWATVEDIAGRAGIGLEEFERRFEGKADVVGALLDSALEDFRAHVEAAYASRSEWPENLRAAAHAVEDWLLGHPDLAWFGLVGVLEGPEVARARREAAILWGADLIDRGRRLAAAPDRVPSSVAIFAIGSIAETLRRRLEESGPPGPQTTMGEMLYHCVRPYLGEEKAVDELLAAERPTTLISSSA